MRPRGRGPAVGRALLAGLAISTGRMTRQIIHLALFILFCIDGCTAVNRCYYHGGGESLNDAPCDPDAEVSVCCGRSSSGGGCLSNRLCMGVDGRMSRGSCTDKNWSSPECPNFCTVLRQGIVVTPCLNGNDSSTTHCCFLDRNCCTDESVLFEAPPARPVTTATWNSKSARYITVQLEPSASPTPTKTPSSSPTHTSTSSLSTSPSTSTPATTTAAPTDSADTTSPSTITTSPDPQPTPPPPRDQQHQPHPQQQASEALPPATTAAIAIGATVGAALTAAVIYLLWRLNKSQKILEQAVSRNPPPQYSYPYGFEPPRSPYYTAETASPKELPSDRSAGELYAGPLPESHPFGRGKPST
ncbi:hypothetical protein QBC41DRAFT_363816 [Cercophora samala]|uniref:Uncharacterized protein n=1 Tax=Cercophora samala TaxID=330535 RepID=A0AA39ZHN9_9PEZI|nr:hypothetical protein QBC41DRAFT_363816 [Cercophora samala]